jgi:hypothetical protein
MESRQEKSATFGGVVTIVAVLAGIVTILLGAKEFGLLGSDQPESLRGLRIEDTSPQTFRQKCPAEFDYTAKISAQEGSGTVRYQLIFASFSSPVRQEHIKASGTTVSEPLTSPGSDTFTVQWRVLEPESAESPPRQIELICQ